MPKIVKNGKEYSGVPLECVTAWQPTGDPVQVAEPLMGNTDISDIGDGTITGAISSLSAGLAEIDITDQVVVSTYGNLNANMKLWYTPATGKVRGSFSGYSQSAYTNTSAFFNIHQPYRPKSVIKCFGTVNLSATSSIATSLITINTGGACIQTHTNGCMGISTWFEYYI